MVDWQSSAELAKDGLVFSRFMHVLLGVYIWEWATSLPFDFDYIFGRRVFRWPMIFYFLNRYCLLFALIGIAIALNVTTEINCQSLYTANQVFGNAAIGLASINFSLRTIAVWNQRWFIWVPLTAVIMGHWSLLLHGKFRSCCSRLVPHARIGVLLKAEWVPDEGGCVITSTSNRILAITFIYSMAFDLTVLILTAWKLLFPAARRSRLVSLIFNDGLIYFVIAFLSNLLATIFMLLNLNAVMSIIANVPAAIASTIVACRAVRRLANYNQTGAQMFGAGQTTAGSTLAFRNTNGSMGVGGQGAQRPKVVTNFGSKDGVHVQMDTFESPTTAVERSYLEYDAATGKLVRSAGSPQSDPEAQLGGDGEFKRPPDEGL
uniref:Transmembrane protein n=1 Tax=Mycena chlorophos TaxID=658473 RepID=A0ABQ0M7C4_MYCCL|nr:predicted protein [Mycena chlorophos]